MRSIYLVVVFSFFYLSCKNNENKSLADQKASAKKDSAAQQGNEPYIVNAEFENFKVYISLVSHGANHLLICYNKEKKTSDTFGVGAAYNTSVVIKDITGSLHLSNSLFQVILRDDDDLWDNDFVEFKDGKFDLAFYLYDYNAKGITLERKDDRTLSGILISRDELFNAKEDDFPVTIDLNTYNVTRHLPDTQYIGFHTVATQSFKAHMIINGRVDERLKDVAVGDSLIIDTLYRNLKKVRLYTADSTKIEIKVETADKKIQKIIGRLGF